MRRKENKRKRKKKLNYKLEEFEIIVTPVYSIHTLPSFTLIYWQRFEAHSGSVTCVTGTVLNQQLVLVTTASDSTIKVWKVPLQDSQPKQEEVFTFDLK